MAPNRVALDRTGEVVSLRTATSGHRDATTAVQSRSSAVATSATTTTTVPTTSSSPAINTGRTEAYAALIVVGAIVIATLAVYAAHSWRSRHAAAGSVTPDPRGGLFMGADGRLSTSKTVAMLWSAIVVFMVITLALIGRHEVSTWFSDQVDKAPAVYLTLLGGPFAAAVLAKIRVSSEIVNGGVKVDGSGVPNLVDLVTDDSGAADLYDFQYVLFNLAVIFVVLLAFLPKPTDGFPPLPDFLAILTGGAALTYTVNKWLNPITDPSPSITQLSVDHGRAETATIIGGANLYSPNASTPVPTQVRFGTALAPTPEPGNVTPNSITVKAPDPGPLQQSHGPNEQSDPIDIVIVANNGMSCTAQRAWVYDPPVIDNINPADGAHGTRVTITGSWLASTKTPNTAPTITFGNVSVNAEPGWNANVITVLAPEQPPGGQNVVDIVVTTNYGMKAMVRGGFTYPVTRADILAYFADRAGQIGAVHTTRTPRGQLLDWVTPQSLTPDGGLAAPPPAVATPLLAEEQAVTFELDDAAVERGPAGTVPVARRDPLQETTAATTQVYLSKPGGGAYHPFMTASEPVNGFFHAVIDSESPCYGVTGVVNVWSPTIQGGEDHSLMQLWLVDETHGQSVEAGWIVSQYQSGDLGPHLFTWYTTDSWTKQGPEVGGYDANQTGWVQYDDTIFPGALIVGASEAGAAQVVLPLQAMLWDGNWWIAVRDRWIGYYPATLFARPADGDTLTTRATRALFGGEVYTSAPNPSTATSQMGGGAFPDAGIGHACFQRNLSIVTDTAGQTAPFQGSQNQEQPTMYRIAPAPVDPTRGSCYLVGGPGATD